MGPFKDLGYNEAAELLEKIGSVGWKEGRYGVLQ